MSQSSEDQMEIQTRNEEGSLQFFSTFEEALQEQKRDPTVWKISWDGTNDIRHRVRLVTKEDILRWWTPESREKLTKISQLYQEAEEDDLLWIWQDTMSYRHMELMKKAVMGEITYEEKEKLLNTDVIRGVYTEEMVKEQFPNLIYQD